MNVLSVEKLFLKFKSNFKIFLSIAVVAVVSVGAAFGWSFFQKQQKEKAVSILYERQKALKSLIKEPEKDSLSFLKQESLDFNKEMEQSAIEYEKAIAAYKSFELTAYFAVDLADLYYRSGKKEKAKSLLSLFSVQKNKRFLFFPSPMSSLSQLALFQLVAYLMDSKECEKALSLLDLILSEPSAKAFYSEARLQKALCLQSFKRYDEAILEYQQIALENPDSYVGRQAEGFEKILILEKKLNSKQ